MLAALDALVGTMPLVLMSGVELKMIERLFPQQQSQRGYRSMRGQPPYRSRGTRVTAGRLNFGNFSNVGL
jgi:hypothetical protein